MKNFIIVLITGILCTHCTQKYIKMDKDNLHSTGQNATKDDTPVEIAKLKEEELIEGLFEATEYQIIDKFSKLFEEVEKRGLTEKVVNFVHKSDRTLLMNLAATGYVELMRRLLAAGAEVDKQDSDGSTALHAAAYTGQTDAVGLLVEKGATIDAADKDSWTALHAAAYEGHAGVVELLVESGASKDAADERSQTPLHKAASQGHTGVVELLVEQGATIDAADKDGSTPLLLAVWYGRVEVARYLLSKGANRGVKDKNKRGVREKLRGIEDFKLKEAMEELLDSYEK